MDKNLIIISRILSSGLHCITNDELLYKNIVDAIFKLIIHLK